MIEKFDETNTTASTLGNANWNGEIDDIRESIRRVNELAEKRAGHSGPEPTTDRIVFTRDAFDIVEPHLHYPGTYGKPIEKFYGIPLEIINGDTPAMLHALARSCLGETVMLVTKGETGLCIRSYSDQFSPEKMGKSPNPPCRLEEVRYNGGLGSCMVPVPYSPFSRLDEPLRFKMKGGQP